MDFAVISGKQVEHALTPHKLGISRPFHPIRPLHPLHHTQPLLHRIPLLPIPLQRAGQPLHVLHQNLHVGVVAGGREDDVVAAAAVHPAVRSWDAVWRCHG